MIDRKIMIAAGSAAILAVAAGVSFLFARQDHTSALLPERTLSALPEDTSPQQLTPALPEPKLETNQSPVLVEDVRTSFSELQEAEIREIVKNYLKKNPNIVIDAIAAHNARETAMNDDRLASALAANITALLDPATSYVAGKKTEAAKVAVVEMYDYHCTFCKRASAWVRKLATGDEAVKVVFRELPVLRRESEYAAKMALASRNQGKFLDLHFAMMDASGLLTKERVDDLARENGVNVIEAEAAIKDQAISSTLRQNHSLATAMGIEGTPAFVVASTNGKYVAIVSGYDPEELSDSIQTAKKTRK